jgi:hypothetical protein
MKNDHHFSKEKCDNVEYCCQIKKIVKFVIADYIEYIENILYVSTFGWEHMAMFTSLAY